MLNEMLDNMKPNEKFAEGDAFDQIASRCRNVQPKIQKWISNADTIGRLQLYTHITHRHDH
jgi:ADP-ribosylation factor-binding protein GGA